MVSIKMWSLYQEISILENFLTRDAVPFNKLTSSKSHLFTWLKLHLQRIALLFINTQSEMLFVVSVDAFENGSEINRQDNAHF